MLLSVLLVPDIKKFSPINIKNLTLSFKSALLSFCQQLEAGLGLGTCGWGSGNVVSACFFLSDPPITGWWFRSLGAQRTKFFREGSVVIRGWWQTFRCWLFLLWGPSVGFFPWLEVPSHGQPRLAGHPACTGPCSYFSLWPRPCLGK